MVSKTALQNTCQMKRNIYLSDLKNQQNRFQKGKQKGKDFHKLSKFVRSARVVQQHVVNGIVLAE